jgi:CBS domain-containing protein
MKCSEIMKRRVEWVAPDASIRQAAQAMDQGRFGMLPVCTPDGRVVGVLTDRDIVLRATAKALPVESPVRDIMTTRVVACRPSNDLSVAERLMLRHHVGRVIVLDDDGRLAGLISLTDIAHCEQPLRAARLLRDVSSREFRLESRGLASTTPPPPIALAQDG